MKEKKRNGDEGKNGRKLNGIKGYRGVDGRM